MYLALYRKFRPKVFDEVIGQDHIVSSLKNQVEKNKISHAYLFTGTRGTGKTSCAKIFAKAINCLNPINGSPCGECEVCKSLNEANNVDILEIDAASNNGVNEIRELREKIKYPPVCGKFKVYIIDEVHMLTDSAFNALLKTLEEPPEHAVFILATTESYKLPATILSRCMRFDFRLVPTELLVQHLKNVLTKSGIKCDEKSLEVISLAGNGSVRDMLSVADCVVSYCGEEITYKKVLEVLGNSEKDELYKIVESIIDGNLGEILTRINELCLNGKNLVSLGKDLSVCFKNLLVVKNCTDPQKILNVTKDEIKILQELSCKVESKKLLVYMEKFSAVESELKFALSPRTLIEITCLECASLDVDSASVKKN